jgi:hypothetical protein
MPDGVGKESPGQNRESTTSDFMKHQILDEFHEYDPVEGELMNNRNLTTMHDKDLDEAHRFTFKKSGESSRRYEKRVFEDQDERQDQNNPNCIFDLNMNHQTS